ncbi:aldose 1-epimerase family protein [Humibacter ginsenosidimutans]|uniref:Aldose 1-epimerase family protein n=1 Tax=Humibacter ginsenosidimutans TaxID=2599293 RepID=A0A5B8M4K8_9MICO|nr:aldose 1-epimerase family protein [Humibacter ginsenosidimutans]
MSRVDPITARGAGSSAPGCGRIRCTDVGALSARAGNRQNEGVSIPISGISIDLAHGDYRASIASVGASLRTLTHDGRDLVVPFEADELRPAFRGATLAPWPNRIVDGRYTFDGVEQQVALTEPALNNALHGLVAWLDFAVRDRGDDFVQLAASIQAQQGYPHRVDLEVVFRLDDDGLHSAVTARNSGTSAAPFGTGPHPYLVAGQGRVDDWTLTLPAADVLAVTADRLAPIGLAAVSSHVGGTAREGELDFRTPRVIGEVFIDHAFTALQRDAAGTAAVEIVAADGHGVAMRWDAACPWVQIHTADRPDPALSRLGLAVEPMTCPPDAFNSGTDLIVLQPGDTTTAGWTIAAL